MCRPIDSSDPEKFVQCGRRTRSRLYMSWTLYYMGELINKYMDLVRKIYPGCLLELLDRFTDRSDIESLEKKHEIQM